MTPLLVLASLAIMGAGAAYLSIWSAIQFHEDFEERVRSILLSVVFDVIIVFTLMFYGSGQLLMAIFGFKFLFLACVDFKRTLDQ